MLMAVRYRIGVIAVENRWWISSWMVAWNGLLVAYLFPPTVIAIRLW